MNPGGDAAEQIVRLSLEGVEVAAKISGNGAKNIGLLLYATLKEEQKTKGKARLTSMLKSGKELKVFTIRQEDLKKFSQEAKRYGVLYCVLKDKNNPDPKAAVDVIARADDAAKIQRITERFRLATVDQGNVTTSIEKEKDRVLPKEKTTDPTLAKTDHGPLSEPDLKQDGRSNGKTGNPSKPSVREKLNGYRADVARKKEERQRTRAQTLDPKASEAVRNAVKSVPGKKVPGKDR